MSTVNTSKQNNPFFVLPDGTPGPNLRTVVINQRYKDLPETWRRCLRELVWNLFENYQHGSPGLRGRIERYYFDQIPRVEQAGRSFLKRFHDNSTDPSLDHFIISVENILDYSRNNVPVFEFCFRFNNTAQKILVSRNLAERPYVHHQGMLKRPEWFGENSPHRVSLKDDTAKIVSRIESALGYSFSSDDRDVVDFLDKECAHVLDSESPQRGFFHYQSSLIAEFGGAEIPETPEKKVSTTAQEVIQSACDYSGYHPVDNRIAQELLRKFNWSDVSITANPPKGVVINTGLGGYGHPSHLFFEKLEDGRFCMKLSPRQYIRRFETDRKSLSDFFLTAYLVPKVFNHQIGDALTVMDLINDRQYRFEKEPDIVAASTWTLVINPNGKEQFSIQLVFQVPEDEPTQIGEILLSELKKKTLA